MPGRPIHWRLVALYGLNLLILVHIVLQQTGLVDHGHTDPLDFRRFIESGAVSIGLILLAVWLLSIPLFGRVLCGWFCHMGAWQEAGMWLMRRIPGLRRLPTIGGGAIVHSRVLKWAVPIFSLAVIVIVSAMKGYAASHETGVHWTQWDGRPVWEVGPWKTAIILFTYVFLINALFGSRALCRYACFFTPAFRPLQAASPFTIRRVGLCDECGACSSKCIMGIDVMHEVLTHGKVKDLECVRCLTCVRTCHTRALAYGTRTCGDPVANPRPRVQRTLPFWHELVVLPVTLVGVLAGVPGVVWGTAFLMSLASLGLSLLTYLRDRRAVAAGRP